MTRDALAAQFQAFRARWVTDSILARDTAAHNHLHAALAAFEATLADALGLSPLGAAPTTESEE